jgi:hypothetical protein
VVNQPLRYVVLQHTDVDEPHFDLMFETLPGSMLATWRSESWPIERRTALTRLRDHRRLYLEYEGQVSGQRGMVYRVAEGNCEVDVGEGGVWTIRLLTGANPQELVFRQISAEQWEAQPG